MIPFMWWDVVLTWEVGVAVPSAAIELLNVQGPFSVFSTKVARIVTCTFKSRCRKGQGLDIQINRLQLGNVLDAIAEATKGRHEENAAELRVSGKARQTTSFCWWVANPLTTPSRCGECLGWIWHQVFQDRWYRFIVDL